MTYLKDTKSAINGIGNICMQYNLESLPFEAVLVSTTVIIAVHDNRWSLCLFPISLAPRSLFVYSSMALDRQNKINCNEKRTKENYEADEYP